MSRVFAALLLLCPIALALEWPEAIETQHYPGAYWWSPGSAFDHESIVQNLEAFAEAGIRNVHIIPIYGAKGHEDRNIDFLSPEWMAQLDDIVKTAQSLGMNIDTTTGTGWCFGGPGLEGELGDTVASWDVDAQALTFKPGRKVKRAAPGGEGMMLNAYSPAAMIEYLKRFDEAFDASGADMPRAQYHDSFEYQGNWSPEIFAYFKAHRGYDLEPRLPEMFDDATTPDIRGRLRYDYRLSLAELHFDTMQVWVDWAHARGFLTRNEAHGSPANLLDIYAQADIPETEMFGAPEFPIPGFRLDPDLSREGDVDWRVTSMAASAAHIAHAPGNQLVASESCTWLREHWNTTLGQVKLQLDQFFLAGVNHVFYHGACYSPVDVPWPGYFFYASTKFDPRNAFWRDIPTLNTYVARCQSILQAGEPSSDVLLYWPIHDLWSDPKGLERKLPVHGPTWMSESKVGALAQELKDQGYTFDFISDDMLSLITLEDGQLKAPGGSYQVIVIPECNFMPIETLEKLETFARKGAKVFFQGQLPHDVPGMANLETRRTRFAALKKRIQGQAVIADDIPLALQSVSISGETSLARLGLSYIRRKIDGGHYYFIANHTEKEVNEDIGLARNAVDVVYLDPMTGAAGQLNHERIDGESVVHFQLPAGATAILKTGGTVDPALPTWNHYQELDLAMTLSGPWSIEFIDGAPTLPKAQALDHLQSWTDNEDPAAHAFAGTGKYTTRFTLSDPANAGEWRLDLGDVRESARVCINGEDAGTVIALPFRLNVGQFLKAGENTLEIEVTNLSANRIRALARENGDTWKIMEDINIVNVDYKPFEPQKWPLKPSGLLGQVRLIPLASTR